MVLAGMFLLVAAQAMAEEANVRICALTKAIECNRDEGCIEWSLQEMNLPRFIKIDFGAKTIISLDKTIRPENTKISSIEKLGDMTVLQGIEQRGWSMELDNDDGFLTLTASGEGHGYIVFGSCLVP
jgi:hypothetical protein